VTKFGGYGIENHVDSSALSEVISRNFGQGVLALGEQNGILPATQTAWMSGCCGVVGFMGP
jgi:hypothetical protein